MDGEKTLKKIKGLHTMREEIIEKIEEKKIIAIIRGQDTETAVKTARANT